MHGDIKVPQKPAKAKPAAAAKPKIDPHPPQPDKDEVIVIDDGETVAVKEKIASRNPWLRLQAWWKSLDRNWRFGVIAAALTIFFAAALGFYYFTQPTSNPSIEIITKPKPPAPITVASPLTGVQVSPAQAGRAVTGIMIENSTFARPQSGLQDAGVVYEAIAEAGITRFLALFQEGTPSYIGPVRSLRPYFIDYAAPFQASIVHVGGSPDALHIVESGNFRNLDQFFNGGYFWRESSRDAPHNVYTSFKLLDQLEKSKGYTKSQFVSWPRKADAKLKTPTATSIDLAISSGDYHDHYDYRAAGNDYNRSEGGAPHIDLLSHSDKIGVRLRPKVVVALVVPLQNGALDSSGAYYSNYQTSGSGVAYVFQDGGVTKGTWTKDGTTGQLELLDGDGHALKLDAGQTWLTLVNDPSQISYK